VGYAVLRSRAGKGHGVAGAQFGSPAIGGRNGEELEGMGVAAVCSRVASESISL
jgi:hypothetical protein